MPMVIVETLDDENTFELIWDTDLNSQTQDIPQLHLKLTNIGNGNASDVMIKFDKNVLQTWIDALKDMNPDGEYKYLADEREFVISYPYILNNPENSIIVTIPSNYLECLIEMYQLEDDFGDEGKELPAIAFDLIYHDIQGSVITYKYCYDNWFEEKACSTSNTGKSSITLLNRIQKVDKH